MGIGDWGLGVGDFYLQQPEVAQNINYNPFGYQPVPQQPQQQIHSNQGNQYNDQAAPMTNTI